MGKNKGIIMAAVLIGGLFLAFFIISRQDIKEKKFAVVGLYAPDIELINAESGNKILSPKLKGKVLFLNFWSSTCKPCRDEMPSIDRLYRQFFDNSEFLLLPVLFKEDPRNGVGYLKYNNFILPVMIDESAKAAGDYGVTGVPETYIIDKKGILRKKFIGPYEWDSPEVIALISDLLKE